jgi:hypothetical protein
VEISCGFIFTALTTARGVHEPLDDAVRHFNEVAGLFDFHFSRNPFLIV